MFQLKPFSFLLLVCLSTSLAIGLTGSPKLAFGQTVRFETNVGDIEVQLHPNDAPLSVANFLSYVNAPDVVNDDGSTERRNYDGTFIHRSVPGFIVQGGGFFAPVNGTVTEVPAQAPIMNEFGISNTRGTLAFAKLGGDPDSATNQWFFNTADNSGVPPLGLDFQNGGFTVFGTVVSGLNVVDQIEALGTGNFGGPFTDVPLISVAPDVFVVVNSVSVVPVLRGDVDLDGAVTFADIPPFIARLSGGVYQNEADVDQNAAIDFADIPAFIAVLSNQ